MYKAYFWLRSTKYLVNPVFETLFLDEPGPIDNSRMGVLRSGVLAVRVSADVCTISHEMWKFLVNIYGGGPEVLARDRLT